MIQKIKNRLEKSLGTYIEDMDRTYSLSKISPVLFNSIKDFLSRKGKKLRPTLFVISYLGHTRARPRNIYRAALSIELLHNFMLIHDDIIDDSGLRRGLPSMHKMLDSHLKKYKKAKFSGKELAIVVGDIVYAMAINALLAIDENARHKESALKKLNDAALYTGSGEFLELLYTVIDIEKVTKENIYKIYDLKTSYYSFSYPLSIGAALAGADQKEIDRLFKYGTYLGRAFQIKDDVLDIFDEEKNTGKPACTDLKEAKKTLLVWHAYKNSSLKDKLYIKRIFKQDVLSKAEILKVRGIMLASGSLDYAKKEMNIFLNKAKTVSASLKIRPEYKKILRSYSDELLALP